MKPSTTLTYLAVALSIALTGCNSESNQNNDHLNGKGAQLEPGGYMYFFEQGVPEAITSTSDNALSTSSEIFKDGTHSLKWQFNAGDQLTFHQDIGYTAENDNDITPLTFMAWVYNAEPSEKTLTFEFGDDHTTQAQFEYGLNFSGWRGIAVPFRDMTGTAVNGMNRLRIIAPEEAGTLHIDQTMMAIPLDNRWPTPDHQQPFINPDVTTMASKNWTALMMYDDMLTTVQPTFDFTAEFDDSTGDSAVLYAQFDEHLAVNPNAKVTQAVIDKNLAQYAAFAIKQNPDGSWQGKQLDHPAHQKFLKTGIVNEDTLATLTDFANIRDLGKAMLASAKYLRSTSLTDEQRTALETAFLNGFHYALDQGWQSGSGMQIISHVGYQTREWFDALFIARHVLAKHNLLEPAQQAMMWFNGTGRIYETDAEITASNVDILNTQLQWMIKSFLLLPNQSDRDTMLKQTQSWLSKTLLASDGLGGGFKADGSIFHHSQHYPAYGKDAFSGLAGAVYGLSHSPYSLTEDAHARIKDALLKMRVYTKDLNTPVVLSGRHPDGKQKITAVPFKWLALAGSPDGAQAIDKELAAAYANLINKTSYEGISAEADPTGTWVMNYASMAISRGTANDNDQSSWLATARGFSRYLVGNETYEANNLYGRYLQYGQLEITPSNIENRAFSHNGWDWNRFPGTTTVHLPNEQLRATLHQLPGAGIEEMLLSTESYSGANHLPDQDTTMFAMKLRGHKKYEQQNLTANKSYFMFDNTVVALGSNINNINSEYPTETTLFQHNIAKASKEAVYKPVEVNGADINELGHTQTLQDTITFTDPAQNRYFITTTAEQPVQFSYMAQQSNHEDNGTPTSGHFATAVIDHGNNPKSAGYEYAILIEATNTQKPDYTVIQRDKAVHAVNMGDIEAYAFFEPTTIATPQHVISAQTPSQIMVLNNAGGNQLTLSVVNPDFAFYDGIDPEQVDANGDQVEVSIYDREWRYNLSQPVKTDFVVKGEWTLKESNDKIRTTLVDGNTHITTTTVDATPLGFMLIKVTP